MADFAELQDRLKILSDAYAAQLPEKLQQVEQAWKQLPHGEWNEECFQSLHRMIHNLTGSGKTFGFPLLSEMARNLEEYLNEFVSSQTVPDEKQHQHIQEMLNKLLQVNMRCALGANDEAGKN